MLLVAGASGHSGGWFIKKLISESYEGNIRCFIRSTSDIGFMRNSPLNIEFSKGDLNDLMFVEKALEGVQTVIHIAGISLSNNIVKACIKHKIEWAIFICTTGIFSKYKSASNGYIDSEKQIINSGINYTIIRPTMIYGSSMDRNIWKLINYIDQHKFFPVFGKGLNLMQPILARDLGEAIYLVLMNKDKCINQEYNIAGKYPISYNKLLMAIANQLNSKTIFLHIPYLLSYIAAHIYNFYKPDAIISVEQVMRMNEDKTFDFSGAEKDFGFSPVAFEDGISDEIDEYLYKSARLCNSNLYR